MASVISVCNAALIKCGEFVITSLGDGTKPANLCSQRYEPMRDEVFRMHPWNCLIQRTDLAPESIDPSWGYAYSYTIPTDAVRILQVNTRGQWRREGRSILTNEGDVLYIRYLARIEDPQLWDESLREVVAARLAIELVEPLTQSRGKKQELKEEFGTILRMAARADAQESSSVPFKEDDWVLARGTGFDDEEWAQ